MPYTAAQLTTIWTNVNQGIAPTASEQLVLNAYSAQNQAGALTDAATLQLVLNSGDSDTAVAIQTYNYFTGKSPTAAGIAYLVNSPLNATDLNDAYYGQFNIENRYINFAANLALFSDATTVSNFSTTYGPLTFAQTVEIAYETIIGSSYAIQAGISPTAAKADIVGRLAYFTNLANANLPAGTAAQKDLMIKAEVIGYIMGEGIKADIGSYATATNSFMSAIGSGTATYNTEIVASYVTSVPGGGTGGLPGASFALTAGVDNVVGTANNDTIAGTVVSDNLGNATATGLQTTYQAVDTVNGGAGLDVLNITVTSQAGGATGAVTLPNASVSAVETVNIRSLSTTVGDLLTVAAGSFAGATSINSDRSTNAISITGMAAGSAAGIIGNGSVANGALTFAYAAVGATTLNLQGGVTGGPAVTQTFAGMTSATINSTGAANTIGALAVSSTNSAATLNIAATSALTTGAITGLGNTAGTTATVNITGTSAVTLGGLTYGGGNLTALTINTNSSTLATGTIANAGFAAGASLTVSGPAASTVATTGAVNVGVLGANILTVNAGGLTAGGVQGTLGANLATTFVGGAGNDVITIGAANMTGTINAGAGADIIAFTDAAFLTAGLSTTVSGFETLRVGGAGGGSQTYDPTIIAGITSYQVTAGTSVILTNLIPNASVTVIGTQTTALTLQLKDASGTTDNINLRIDNLTTTGTNVSGTTVAALTTGGTVSAGQVETLSITSAGRVAGTGTYNVLTLAASGAAQPFADANTVKISGASGLQLNTGVTQHAQTIDASAHTGGVVINSVADASGAATPGSFVIIGSNVNDTINAGNTSSIYGGGGGDAIVLTSASGARVHTLVYKVATDSQMDFAGVIAAGSVGASGTGGTVATSKLDVITGFVTGQDKIDVSTFGFGAGALGGGIADKGVAATDAAFTTLLTTAGLFSDGVLTRGLAQIHGTAGMSSGVAGDFIVVDVNKDGLYTAGTDLVIKLAATASVVISDFNI